MGLDITAYSNLRIAEGVETDEDGDVPDDCTSVFPSGEAFPDHAGGGKQPKTGALPRQW